MPCSFLMLWICPRMHEAYCYGFNAVFKQYFTQLSNLVLVERNQYSAVGCNSLCNRPTPRPRHQFNRAFHMDVIGIEPFFKSHGQNITESFGGNECRSRTFSFNKSICRQGCAVNKELNITPAQPRLIQQLIYTFHDSQFRCLWSGQYFAAV